MDIIWTFYYVTFLGGFEELTMTKTNFLILKFVVASYFAFCFNIVNDVYEEIRKIEKAKNAKNNDVETGQASDSGDVGKF